METAWRINEAARFSGGSEGGTSFGSTAPTNCTGGNMVLVSAMAFWNNDKVSSINRSSSLCVSAISAPKAQNLALTKCPLNRQSYTLHQMGDRFWRIVRGSRFYEIVSRGIRTWFVGTVFYISIRDRIMLLQHVKVTI